MKLRGFHQKVTALTMVEVLVVVSVIALLVLILLPALSAAKRKASEVNCVSRLKLIGLSYCIWSGENGGKFPTEVSVTNGGAMELAATGNAAAVFLIMSNELCTPKFLICPNDKQHLTATNFDSGFSAKNISYFVGLDAGTNLPLAFLSGDDNFRIKGDPVNSGLLEITPTMSVGWTAARHDLAGNICLADGSVHVTGNTNLQTLIVETDLATNRLVIP